MFRQTKPGSIDAPRLVLIRFVFGNRLPAAVSISPVAAVAVSTAAASASTASATPSSTAPETATPVSAAGAASSALRGSRFVDDNFAAHEILAVQSLYGALGFLITIDFDESEPAWLARETVAHQGHIRRGDSRLRKETADLLFRSLKRQIADVKFLQRKAPSGRGKAGPRDRELKRAGSSLGAWARAQDGSTRGFSSAGRILL